MPKLKLVDRMSDVWQSLRNQAHSLYESLITSTPVYKNSQNKHNHELISLNESHKRESLSTKSQLSELEKQLGFVKGDLFEANNHIQKLSNSNRQISLKYEQFEQETKRQITAVASQLSNLKNENNYLLRAGERQVKRQRRLRTLRHLHQAHAERRKIVYGAAKARQKIEEYQEACREAVACILRGNSFGYQADFKEMLEQIGIPETILSDSKKLEERVTFYESSFQKLVTQASSKAQLEALEPIFPILLEGTSRSKNSPIRISKMGYYVEGNFSQAFGKPEGYYQQLENLFDDIDLGPIDIYSDSKQIKRHNVVIYHSSVEKYLDSEKTKKVHVDIYRMNLGGAEGVIVCPTKLNMLKEKAQALLDRKLKDHDTFIKRLSETVHQYRKIFREKKIPLDIPNTL